MEDDNTNCNCFIFYMFGWIFFSNKLQNIQMEEELYSKYE